VGIRAGAKSGEGEAGEAVGEEGEEAVGVEPVEHLALAQK
jgi:hypothetical protein